MRTRIPRLAPGLGLALAVALPLALASPAPAATISWNDPALEGGSFHEAANWQDSDGNAVSSPPGPGDVASFDLGDGAVSLSSPVTLEQQTETETLSVLGGGVELDLSGHDYEATSATGALFVVPNSLDPAEREPALTLSNGATGSGSEAVFRAPSGSVELSDGGALAVEGGATRLEASRVAVGVTGGVADPATSGLTVDGATVGAVSRIDVGATEDGTLTVENGGRILELPSSSGEKGLGLYLGDAADAVGSAVLRDAGTQVGAEGVVVGGRGEGSLSLEGGAELDVRDRVLVGGVPSQTGSRSTIAIDGGSHLEAKLLQVGTTIDDENDPTQAAGGLTLTDGTIDVKRFVARDGDLSQLALDGGAISVSTHLRVDTDAPLSLGSELDLDFSSPSQSAVFRDAVTLEAGSALRLNGGFLSVPSIDEAGGSFEWNAGSLNLRESGATAGQGTDALLPAELELGGTRDSLSLGGVLTIDGDTSVEPTSSGGAVTLGEDGYLAVDSIERVNGGSFTWTGGHLELDDPDGVLTLESGGLVGDAVTLDATRSLDVAGTTEIASGASLALDGGIFRTGSLVGDGFSWTSGTLDVASLRAGTGADELSSDLTIGPNRGLEADHLEIDDVAVTLAGGQAEVRSSLAVDSGAGGRLDFDTGQLTMRTDLTVCDGGLTGASGAGTVTLGAGDRIAVEPFGLDPPPATTTIADGAAIELQGGTLDTDALALEGSGALRFGSGTVDVEQGLTVGPSGLQDLGGSGTLTLGTDDVLRSEQGTLTVADGATLAVAGGQAEILGLALEGTGAAHFDTGVLESRGDLAVSPDGLLGTGGASTVALGAGDEIDVLNALTIGDSQEVRVEGGRLDVGELQGDGALDLQSGELHLDEQDLYVGSSFDAGSVGDGYRLASNTGGGSSFYYSIGDGTEIRVGSGHHTHVDASGLEIADGGVLSTWELDAPSNVTIQPGGTLDVRHVVFDADSLFSGTETFELVDVGAELTLDSNAHLIAQQTAVATGATVDVPDSATLSGETTVSDGGSLGGSGTVEGSLVNSGTLEPGSSPGTLTVDGSFEQLDPGTIVLELGREDGGDDLLHDVLSVSGTVDLDGEVELVVDTSSAGLDPSFDPSTEDGLSFTAIQGSRVRGLFDDVLNAAVGNGRKWVLEYFPNRVDVSLLSSSSPDLIDHRLRAVPEPGTALLVGLGLLALGRSRAGRRPAA